MLSAKQIPTVTPVRTDSFPSPVYRKIQAEYQAALRDYAMAIRTLDGVSGHAYQEALKHADKARDRLDAVRLDMEIEFFKDLEQMQSLAH